jgi:guanylate kinase
MDLFQGYFFIVDHPGSYLTPMFFMMSSVTAVETVQKAGKICILDIDVQGVQKVKQSDLKPIYLFIAPPSMAALESRLRGRGTETEEQIKKRLANAAKELEYGQQAGNFDRVFINADLNATFEDLAAAFNEWYPRLMEVAPDDGETPKNCTSKCAIS